MGDKVRYQQANTNFSVIVILIDITKLKIFSKKKLQIKKKYIFFSITTFCFNLFLCFVLLCFVLVFFLICYLAGTATLGHCGGSSLFL